MRRPELGRRAAKTEITVASSRSHRNGSSGCSPRSGCSGTSPTTSVGHRRGPLEHRRGRASGKFACAMASRRPRTRCRAWMTDAKVHVAKFFLPRARRQRRAVARPLARVAIAAPGVKRALAAKCVRRHRRAKSVLRRMARRQLLSPSSSDLVRRVHMVQRDAAVGFERAALYVPSQQRRRECDEAGARWRNSLRRSTRCTQTPATPTRRGWRGTTSRRTRRWPSAAPTSAAASLAAP